MKAIVIPVLYLGPGALVVMSTSLLVGGALGVWRGRLGRLAPEAQGRVLTAASWAPPLVGVLFMGGGIADWLYFSGVNSFCLRPEEMMVRPSILLIMAFCIVSIRVLIGGGAIARDLWRSRGVTRAFRDVTAPGIANCRLLPLEEPRAFVLGFVNPQVYVSRGLLEAVHRKDVDAVLAHEEAHLRRRDPLRRLIASLGLMFHLPGIAGMLQRYLTRAQELAADAEAACKVGDRVRVAEALIRFGRLRLVRAAAAIEFASGNLEARVLELLDANQRCREPSGAMLLAGMAVLCLAALLAAHPLHFAEQVLLRLP